MTLEVDVQRATDEENVPSAEDFERWGAAAAVNVGQAEVVVRIVGEAEGRALNEMYSHRRGPTNVLAFPFEAPPRVSSPLLGDIVLCAPVIRREARSQAKSEPSHWAHMVVHGMLHLQGYDHHSDGEADVMERLETRIMARLGYPEPYE